MGDWMLDIRTGLRQLRRAPGVGVAAILTLAIGIGATTGVFSVVAAVLSRSRPVDDMDRRVALWSRNRGEAETKRAVSPGDFLDWRDRARLVDQMVATRSRSFNLSGAGLPIRVSGSEVTGGYFTFFKWSPVAGRGIEEADTRAGADRVVVLSDRFWRTQMGARPGVVGESVRLDGEPATIIGVLPPDGVSDGIFVPLDTQKEERSARSLFVWARLKPQVTIEQARADLDTIARALEAEHPDADRGWTVNVRPLQEEFVGPQARLVFAALFLTAMAVLLIGCVNVANLLLARGIARQGELAVRAALGAGRWRLARQLLTECAVIAACGAALSLAVARAVVAVLIAVMPVDSPWVSGGALNVRMLAVTAAAALIATLAAGVMPALVAPRDGLASGARAGTGPSPRRLTRLLVAAEVALAVVLLVQAGLLTRTLGALVRLDPGFDVTHLLTARVSLPDRTVDADAVRWFAQALDRAGSLPGVAAAAATSRLPFAGGRFNPNRGLVIEGQPAPADRAAFAVDYTVTPGYLSALRLPLREGRDLRRGDAAGAPLVAIVSETLRRQYWGGRSPIGARLRQGDEPPGTWRTVVGVVGDVRNDDADQPPLPYLYVPLAQHPERSMALVLRTTGNPRMTAESLRHAIAGFDAGQPLFDVQTMDDILDADLSDSRVLIKVLGAFALVALGLAGLGIWSVVAQMAGQRVREIGVRVALGATAGQIVRLLVGQGLRPVLIGLGVGLAAAVGAGRAMQSVLFQVSPQDPASITGACLVLLTVALVAVGVPARAASRLNPVDALRAE